MSLFTPHRPRRNPASTHNQQQLQSTPTDLHKGLIAACRTGDFHRVRFSLSQCTTESASHQLINQQDAKSGLMTALHTTVMRGHRDLTLYLISVGADVNIIDAAGWTPLHWAVHQGFIELACHLIAAGSFPDDPKHAIRVIKLAIDGKFGVVDQVLAQLEQPQSTTTTTNDQLARIKQVLASARVTNNHHDIDILFSTIGGEKFSPQMKDKWNLPTLLKQHQSCLDFAQKCLKDTPMAKDYGEIQLDDVVDSEDDCGFVSDTDDSD